MRERIAALTPFLVAKVTQMGLFGLGLPEIAVIGGVAALIFGAQLNAAAVPHQIIE